MPLEMGDQRVGVRDVPAIAARKARYFVTADAWLGRGTDWKGLFMPRLWPWGPKRARRNRDAALAIVSSRHLAPGAASGLGTHPLYPVRTSSSISKGVGSSAPAEGEVGPSQYEVKQQVQVDAIEETREAEDKEEMPFYGLDDELPILLSIIAGLQHCLSMLAGIITPPIIFASSLQLSAHTQAYMVSASLITSGILSAVQMSRIPLPFNRQLGTGLLSVVGISFATLSTASSVFDNMYTDGTCPVATAADGSTQRLPCPDAYGYILGTSAVCALLEILLSNIPPRVLRRMFPPIITGAVVFLIGLSLIGSSGAPNWGGGSNCMGRPEGEYAVCPSVGAARTTLPWGSPALLGLGALAFGIIVLTEIWGSPVMRNMSIVLGLILPLIVAGPTGFISRNSINSAPAITFIWTTTFRLRVYGPAVLPMLAVYCSLAAEAIGDITASSEASRQPVQGELFDKRVQGGILSDGIGGVISALFTCAPMSVFAQNNGVIAITRIANRRAGYWCCFWLILMGILGKFSGALLAIPNPILGGVTTFLFTSVMVSGLKILSSIKYTRRNRFILTCSLAFGLIDILSSDFFSYLFADVHSGNKALMGFLNSIVIILSTPFLLSAIVGMLLNLVLPMDVEDYVVEYELQAPVLPGQPLHIPNQYGSADEIVPAPLPNDIARDVDEKMA